MRLRAISDNGTELLRRDFTVGKIQLQLYDAWNGVSTFSLPLANPTNAVTVVPPGDYVYLRASGVPSALEQTFGWQVGTNAPVAGAFIELTSEPPSNIVVNLTIDDPQLIPLTVIFPALTGVEGHDVMAPSQPSATAITDPAGYGYLVTNIVYELLETYYSAYGANGGKYLATAYFHGNSASAECNVWPEYEHGEVPFIVQYPGSPCAVCSVINFSLLQYTPADGGSYEPVNADWSGDGVPANTTNTAYCSVGPMGPGTFNILATNAEYNFPYGFSTYADDLQTLSCSGVTVTNEPKTIYMASGAQPGVTAVKWCSICAWDTWFSGPVSNQNGTGNTLTGTLNLPAPGPYGVSVSKGGKTLTLNVEALYVEFADTNVLNLAWSQGGSYNLNNALAGNTYAPGGLTWTGAGVSNNGVLYFGSPGSYVVYAASSDLPSCSDSKTVNLINVDIRQTETNIWIGGGNVTLDMTNSYLGSGTANWSSQPAGISGSGSSISFSPSTLTAGTYTVTAQSSVLPECQDTCIVRVIEVDSVEVSCPVATNSPQFFEGGKTNFGDPCSATETGQTLIVYYDAAVDANFQVQDFDVTLESHVLPSSITAEQFNENWSKTHGPNSGSLDKTDTFEVKYQNPKEGGLYQFEFDLGLGGCSNSGANVLLPLAGADMTSWLDTEAKAVGTWATTQKAAVEDANDSAIPRLGRYHVFQTWCSISGSFFDYVFDPVDTDQHAPCRRFQPYIGSGGYYGYVTVNGVVVHGSKINNMLWALFGRYWGWNETSLRLGAYLNQAARNLKIDGTTSQNAIGFGDDIHALLQGNPSSSITNVLTPTALRTLQDSSSLIEEKLWPSPNAADTGNSTFVAPTNLPTTP